MHINIANDYHNLGRGLVCEILNNAIRECYKKTFSYFHIYHIYAKYFYCDILNKISIGGIQFRILPCGDGNSVRVNEINITCQSLHLIKT